MISNTHTTYYPSPAAVYIPDHQRQKLMAPLVFWTNQMVDRMIRYIGVFEYWKRYLISSLVYYKFCGTWEKSFWIAFTQIYVTNRYRYLKCFLLLLSESFDRNQELIYRSVYNIIYNHHFHFTVTTLQLQLPFRVIKKIM